MERLICPKDGAEYTPAWWETRRERAFAGSLLCQLRVISDQWGSWYPLCCMTFMFFYPLEEDIATHSSSLAWKMSRTGSLGACSLWGRRTWLKRLSSISSDEHEGSYWGWWKCSEVVYFLKVDVALSSQFTKNHWAVHLKWVNFMAYKLYYDNVLKNWGQLKKTC